MTPILTPSQLTAYQQQGYLVLNEWFDAHLMETLKSAALAIVDNFDPASTRSIFSTKTADTNTDEYFLTSGDKVRCFFEEEAFNENGQLKQSKHHSINKIGHALHRHHADFSAFSQSKDITELAKILGVVEPEIRQSMYIFKQPRIGGEIRWHQDVTYFMTTPVSVVTFWIAIEDANLQNGCLQVAPNCADFPIKEQFKRYKDDTTELVSLNPISWPANESALPLEVKAGSLVVFNGRLPHFSEANRSTKSRHAFTLHITCAQTQYSEFNWLQAKAVRL